MIKDRDIIAMALNTLRIRKLRSALTVLGVVIGVAAIMVVMAVGGSARDLIVGEAQVFGSDVVNVSGGSGPIDVAGTVLSDVLTREDLEALRRAENVPDATAVNPTVSGSATLSYQSEATLALIVGTDYQLFDMHDIHASMGRLLTEEDIQSNARVIVLGKNVAEDLFGLSSTIGEDIIIKGERYEVIGITAPKSNLILQVDDMVFMPYTTAHARILGIRHFHEFSIKAANEDKLDGVRRDAEQTLREQHGIEDPEDDDFYIQTPSDVAATIENIFGILTTFLGLVAAISLIVGGIGVMNIMLISVTERTREIGLRKALGAARENILLQFLIEAVVLTFAGGVLGVLLGLGTTWVIVEAANYITGLNFLFLISFPAIGLGLGVSVVVGVVFGVYPARRAAEKSPIDALRYE